MYNSNYGSNSQPAGQYTQYTGNGQSKFGGTPLYQDQQPGYGQPPQQQYGYQQPAQQPYGYQHPQQGGYAPIDPGVELERHATTHIHVLIRMLNSTNQMGAAIEPFVWAHIPPLVGDMVKDWNIILRELGHRFNEEQLGKMIASCAVLTEIAKNERMKHDLMTYDRGTWDMIMASFTTYVDIIEGNFVKLGGRTNGYGQPQQGGYGYQPQQQRASVGSNGLKTDLFTTTHQQPNKPQQPSLTTAKSSGLFHVAVEAERERVMTQPSSVEQPREEPAFVPNPGQRYYDDSNEAKRPTPVQKPQNAPQPVHTRSNSNAAWNGGNTRTTIPPRIQDGPLEMGSDPIFNQMAEDMHRVAVGRDSDFQYQQAMQQSAQPEVEGIEILTEADLPPLNADLYFDMSPKAEPIVGGDDDGVMEDFDDLSFDPTKPHHTDLDLDAFEARLRVANGAPINGWRLYDRRQHPDARFPITRPFPMAYDVLTQNRYLFLNEDNIIIEVIKAKTMDMNDHIDDDLSVSTEGKRVNILQVLAGVEQRMNISANRREVKEDKEKGISAIVATADQKAFDNTPINTTSSEVTEALIAKLSDKRETTIEGYHERRLTPVFMGAKGMAALQVFSNTLGSIPTFRSFADRVPEALAKMPAAFAKEFTARITAYFNEMVKYRLGSEYQCDDFFEDFSEMVEVMTEELGASILMDKMQAEYKRFARFAKVMPRDAGGYGDVLGSAFAGGDFVVFVTTISTLAVPFSSEEAGEILPTADTASLGVNETDTPRLYGLIKAMRTAGRETFNSDANILRFVTSDGKVYYVETSSFSVEGDVFVVSSQNFIADHLA